MRDFDLPIMKNKINGFAEHCEYKVIVDTLKIARKRLGLMVDSNGERIHTIRFSLDECAKKLWPGEESKGAINIDLFKEEIENLDEEKLAAIKKYCLQDVKLTKQLFEEVCKQFFHFKSLMDVHNQRNYKWISKNLGSYSYSVLCHMLKIEEKYGEGNVDEETYAGGAVIDPRVKELHGDCYVLDFVSEYPHAFFQFNLFTPAGEIHGDNCIREKCPHFFTGNEIFSLDGNYCIKEFGKKEKILKELFLRRLQFKKEKNPVEQALKIVINSLYGITAKPVFTQVYYPYRASDCCKIGRQFLLYADFYFTEKGYIVAGGDTDSLFIKDPFENKKKLLKEIDRFIAILKKNIPFPSETFTMGVDRELSDMWFFQKKQYIMLTKDGKLIIKGLPIMKSNASQLSKLVFENQLKQRIISTHRLKYKLSEIREYIEEEIKKDITIVASEFNISEDDNHYTNESSLQAQIKKKYGGGKLLLVKNRRIGVGKGVKYCTLEEAKKLRSFDIDLSTVFDELSPFTVDTSLRNLDNYSDTSDEILTKEYLGVKLET
jgi:DNA polymerase elongation subunit (family B)